MQRVEQKIRTLKPGCLIQGCCIQVGLYYYRLRWFDWAFYKNLLFLQVFGLLNQMMETL